MNKSQREKATLSVSSHRQRHSPNPSSPVPRLPDSYYLTGEHQLGCSLLGLHNGTVTWHTEQTSSNHGIFDQGRALISEGRDLGTAPINSTACASCTASSISDFAAHTQIALQLQQKSSSHNDKQVFYFEIARFSGMKWKGGGGTSVKYRVYWMPNSHSVS